MHKRIFWLWLILEAWWKWVTVLHHCKSEFSYVCRMKCISERLNFRIFWFDSVRCNCTIAYDGILSFLPFCHGLFDILDQLVLTHLYMRFNGKMYHQKTHATSSKTTAANTVAVFQVKLGSRYFHLIKTRNISTLLQCNNNNNNNEMATETLRCRLNELTELLVGLPQPKTK